MQLHGEFGRNCKYDPFGPLDPHVQVVYFSLIGDGAALGVAQVLVLFRNVHVYSYLKSGRGHSGPKGGHIHRQIDGQSDVHVRLVLDRAMALASFNMDKLGQFRFVQY